MMSNGTTKPDVGVFDEALKEYSRIVNKGQPPSAEIQRVMLAMTQFPVLVPVFLKIVDQYASEITNSYKEINERYQQADIVVGNVKKS